MASCIHIENLLQAYIDGEMSTSTRLMFEEHVASCPSCSEQLRETRSVSALLFETLREDCLTEDLVPAVMAHLPEMETAHSQHGAIHHHTDQEESRTRRWFHAVPKLIPVFVPIILMVLGALLWAAWPSFQFGGERPVGVVTYRQGAVSTGHVSHARLRNVRVRDIVTDGGTYLTGTDGRLQLGLAGPSHVAVYENTLVEVNNAREVVLRRGGVFLDVARDVRPFIMQTPNGNIRVLGTSFHVDITDSGTEVTVVNGEVLVENDKSFARAKRGCQVVFLSGQLPVVRQNVDVGPYLAQARAINPDTVAERYFLSRINLDDSGGVAAAEQVFVVDTKRRPVGALILRWIPDPYSGGHAGYNIYVSDSVMTPLFKASIPPSIFQDKNQNALSIPTPSAEGIREVSLLHITVMPDLDGGLIETTFTDISAIGVKR